MEGIYWRIIAKALSDIQWRTADLGQLLDCPRDRCQCCGEAVVP